MKKLLFGAVIALGVFTLIGMFGDRIGGTFRDMADTITAASKR